MNQHAKTNQHAKHLGQRQFSS